ncbi:MAG: GIY-YIG nuclease family protein [Acidithiobacillus sp.]|nr:GIY-YIG nuclease family protein [Acidithiobacillus sp.]
MSSEPTLRPSPPSYAALRSWLAAHRLPPLACIDLESTGPHLHQDRILEIGIVFVAAEQEPETYQQFVQPGCRIPAAITQLTGIHDALVQAAPDFSQIALDLRARLEGHILVAHNVRFDLGFLRQAFLREELRYTPQSLCSVKLSRSLYPEQKRHGIDALLERLEISCAHRHRALGDAQVVAEFLDRMASQRPQELLYACQQQWQQPGLPPYLETPASLEEIPNKPGVYFFFGENDLPLYIGKSIHLRRRIQDHFRNDQSDEREMRMSQQLRRIQWVETAGELGALLLEAQLIKERSPLYNRQLRRRQELWTLRLDTNRDPVVRTVGREELVPGICYGTFPSRFAAKKALRRLAEEERLCDLRLGLQRGRGPCFGYQIHRCLGVCAGQESPEEHDQRLALALERLRIQHWPYAGPIAIRQDVGGEEKFHVFDQWRYLGILGEAAGLAPEAGFDVDTYRILLRFFRKARDGEIQILDEAGTPSGSDGV